MALCVQLTSFNVLERENNKNMIVWTFPSISASMQKLLLTNCFSFTTEDVFFCLRKNHEWVYMKQCSFGKRFAIALVTKEFNLGKYEIICNLLVMDYTKRNNPPELVRHYLTLFLTGYYTYQENGCLVTHDLEKYKTRTNVKDLIRRLGKNVILVYLAIILKMRVLVYHNNIEILQQNLMELNVFASKDCELKFFKHKACKTNVFSPYDKTEHLHPLVHPASLELKSVKFYLAGTINENNCTRSSLYDVYVNLPLNQIKVSPESKVLESFVKTRKLQDVAQFFLELVNRNIAEEMVVKEIELKTLFLLDHLQPLQYDEHNQPVLCVNSFKLQNYEAKLEDFLLKLAVAHNILFKY